MSPPVGKEWQRHWAKNCHVLSISELSGAGWKLSSQRATMTPSVASMIWSMLLMPSWFSIFLKSSSKTFRCEKLAELAHLVPCAGHSMLRAPLSNLRLWKRTLTWKILEDLESALTYHQSFGSNVMQFPYHFHPLPLGVEIILMLRPRTPKVLRISLMSSASWRDLARSGEPWISASQWVTGCLWAILKSLLSLSKSFNIFQPVQQCNDWSGKRLKTFENVNMEETWQIRSVYQEARLQMTNEEHGILLVQTQNLRETLQQLEPRHNPWTKLFAGLYKASRNEIDCLNLATSALGALNIRWLRDQPENIRNNLPEKITA